MLKIYFLFIFTLFSFVEMAAQDNSQILTMATADSTCIAVNKKAGWQQYGSYLTPLQSDNVMIEMIVQHDKSIDWMQDQLVGHIKLPNLLPTTEQMLSFKLINDVYDLRIEPNGECYLRLISGSLPDTDPVIIPIKVVYNL